ncbi:MAG: hypothetical protein ACOCXQ_02120 [Patescibacteria group bacterium]
MDEQQEQAQFSNALIRNPRIGFEMQHSREDVLLLIRQHPVTQITWFLNMLGIILIVILLNFFLPQVLTVQQVIFTNIFGLTVAFYYGWINFLRWYFHVGLLTSQRIVDIDFNSILYKEVSIAELRDVEETTTKSAGYLSSFFNYGDIFIQTAGSKINIEYHNAPNPALIIRYINELTSRINGRNA